MAAAEPTRCDVFSFAVLALYVATGAPPHQGLTNEQIFVKVATHALSTPFAHSTLTLTLTLTHALSTPSTHSSTRGQVAVAKQRTDVAQGFAGEDEYAEVDACAQ